MSIVTAARAEGLTELEYLGDGVYAGYDGYQIWLLVERDGRTERVALEPATLLALQRYRMRVGR